MLTAFVSTIAFLAADAGAAAPAILEPRPMEAAAPSATRPALQRPAAQKPAPKPAQVILAAQTTATPVAKPPAADATQSPPARAAFDDLSDAEIGAKVIDYLQSLTTLAGDFVQTSPTGQTIGGKFYLRRPGQIRFDYDDPSPITIVATSGMVYVENTDLETTDSYPLKKTPLKFLLAKKIDLGDARLAGVERNADAVAVTYSSTDEQTEGAITLVLDAPTLSIREWHVEDAQGGVTSVVLDSVKSGDALENRLFRAPDAGGAFIND